MAATAMEGAAADPRLTEAKKYEYFSSINSMARKIMQEREKIKEKYGEAWEDMSPAEQDTAIDDGMMEPKVRARYAMHRTEREEVVCYPKLLIQTGQKTVHFGEEDLTWQDEHSAPFSWETKSQLEFSVITGAPESSSSSSTSSSIPESKPKTPGPEVSLSARRDEEASFWKLNAERSRLEGEKADFQSLTPSQIKSLEKGEKPLPSYMRSDSVPKEAVQEPAVPRPVKPRVTKPPAPPPPAPLSVTPAPLSVTPAPLSVTPAPLSVTPAPLSVTPAPLSVTPAPLSINLSVTPTPISIAPAPSAPLGGWERSQSTLPSISGTLDDVFSPGLSAKTPSESTHGNEKEDNNVQAGSPAFSQYNTSSSILKTGFDFLDNW